MLLADCFRFVPDKAQVIVSLAVILLKAAWAVHDYHE